MRALLAFALLLVGLPALADPYQRLYQAAGWPDQRAHFSDALDAAQKRYQDKLPPALYQTLVDNSNRRFAPAEVDQRALNGLRENLPDSASPLNFFESPLGRKVVAAEVLATRRDQLLQHSNGLPRQTASEPRRALVKRLAQVLPAREAGAEVSLALAGSPPTASARCFRASRPAWRRTDRPVAGRPAPAPGAADRRGPGEHPAVCLPRSLRCGTHPVRELRRVAGRPQLLPGGPGRAESRPGGGPGGRP